jgi:hypothetical protein
MKVFFLWYKARLWNEADQTVSVAESDKKFNKVTETPFQACFSAQYAVFCNRAQHVQ